MNYPKPKKLELTGFAVIEDHDRKANGRKGKSKSPWASKAACGTAKARASLAAWKARQR